ncbi:uncharacterized protein LOC107623660 isoform X1 [Arachis ipaensis]|uniref:uncharacterized protein LOC107623660 isoform X1 n=1 Tax=Arachis ipaensis TaxID=130454 RepID=UPI000A2AFCC2|nr:uncharacterized protein LOC107623660 isoform X1 [Arachis ipaensis]
MLLALPSRYRSSTSSSRLAHPYWTSAVLRVLGFKLLARASVLPIMAVPFSASISRFFSRLRMVPVIALVGFELFNRGFLVVGSCIEIGIPMLILFIALSQVQFKSRH